MYNDLQDEKVPENKNFSDTKYLKPGCKENALVKFNEVWPHSP